MRMCKCILLIIGLCCFFLSVDAAKYKVNVGSALNVREMPSVSAEVVGKLNNGDIVECNSVEGNDNWLAVTMSDGKIGYASAMYLQEYTESMKEKASSGTIVEDFLNRILGTAGNGNKNLAYLILAEVLLMWFICKFIRKVNSNTFASKGYTSLGMKRWFVILLLLTSGTIFCYVRDMGANALWFIQPSVVKSWWYVIVNFVIFLYVFINLFIYFLKTMDDLSIIYRGYINVMIGLIGWGIGIVALIVGRLFDAEWLDYILWFEVLAQGIQLIIIACMLWRGGGIWGVLVSCLVYLIGTVSLVVLAVPLVAVALAMVATVIVLCAIGGGESVSSQTDSYDWNEWHGQIYRAGDGYNIDDYAGNTHRISSEYSDHYYTTDGQVWSKDGMRTS